MKKVVTIIILLLLSSKSAEAFSGKVGTYFFHWYRCPDEPVSDPHSPGSNACDVSGNKILNIAPGMKKDDPFPEGGYYHWLNLNWYKREFTDMVNTGIDYAFVVDFYSADQVKMMGNAVLQLNLPLKIGFFWDPTAETAGIVDLSRQVDIEKLYNDYVYPFYSALPKSVWVLYNGRPVIFTVYAEQEAHLEKGRELFSYIKSKFKGDFGVDPWLIVESSWWGQSDLSGVADGRYSWGGSVNIRNDNIGDYKVTNLGPGIDMRNTPWGGASSPYVDRKDGDRFKELLSAVPNDSNLLMIETWNELFENTGISRAINYKKSTGEQLTEDYYMAILRNYLGKALGYGAMVKSINLSGEINKGESFTVTFNVLNNGYSFWTKKNDYRLGVKVKKGSSIVWEGRADLLENQVIFPGSEVTFSLNVPPINESGNFTLEAQMLKEHVEWFGDLLARSINVTGGLQYLGLGWNFVGAKRANSGVEQCKVSRKVLGNWISSGLPESGGLYYKCPRILSL